MKTILSAALVFCLTAMVALGAMSNATALTKAKKLFGPMAYLYTGKATTDAATTKEIRVVSTHCKEPYTVMGSGLGTWEAAFFKVPTDTVKGPFSGPVTLKQTAYDDISVTSVRFVFDDVITSERVAAPAKFVQVQMVWGTAAYTNGVHIVCTVITDSDGNVSRTPAWAVLVDQAQPSIGTGIDFSDKYGQPLVSGKP